MVNTAARALVGTLSEARKRAGWDRLSGGSPWRALSSEAMRPHTGKVKIQAVNMSPLTPQRTADNRRVAPHHDGGADRMGRAERNAQPGRQLNCQGGAGLRCEAVDGLKFRQLDAHRLHDPPAAGRRSIPIMQAHARMTHVGTTNAGSIR
jgi:hypothetical protein